jgi:hypothetical protein
MDRTGDGEDFRFDEFAALTRPPLLTPETRALTAAGLVLCSFFAGGLFQFLGFLIVERTGGYGETVQYTVYAAPTGLMAAAGAWLGRQALGGLALDRVLRGLAGAAFVIGVVIAVATTVGIVAALALASDL